MLIPKNSFLEGKTTDEVDFSPYGVLLIGMIDEALGHSFVFITAGINHELNYGDTIVCIGPEDKLNAFEEEIKKKESQRMKLAVIGAGKWGQALYHAYSQNNDVVIHSRTPKEIENFVSLDEALDREYLDHGDPCTVCPRMDGK